MEFAIKNSHVYGLERAIKASGNPMRTVIDESDANDKDYIRAFKLGSVRNGEGHDNFLKGILVHLDIYAPLFWWKQAQRYHWFDFISSQSTMHCLLKFDIKSQCISDTDPRVIAIAQEKANEVSKLELTDPMRNKKWRELVASVPSGFCLGATMTTNYQQLKTMYLQRRNHKLNEWHIFCKWCETLPHFCELTGVDKL